MCGCVATAGRRSVVPQSTQCRPVAPLPTSEAGPTLRSAAVVGLAAFLAVATLAAMTPQQKAEMVVVTSASPRVFTGTAGITFADQEGGLVKAFESAPPWRAARDYATPAEA